MTKSIAELLGELTAYDPLPKSALVEAVTRAEEIAPALIDLIERAAAGEIKTEAEANQVFLGVHVLGAAQEKAAFLPLMRMLRRPSEELDVLLSDAVHFGLPRIVISLFGDADELFALLSDRSVDEFVRYSLFRALAFLTWEGKIERERTILFLERFDAEDLADEYDTAWSGWEEAIALLGLRHLVPKVEASWRSERPLPSLVDPEDFHEMLERAEQEGTGGSRFADEELGPVEDVLEVLDWLDWSSEGNSAKPDPAGTGEPRSPDALLRDLATADLSSSAALTEAVERVKEIAPRLLHVLERAASGEVDTEEDANLVYYGLLVLAAARNQAAFAPLMRLLRLPSDKIDWLFRDGVPEPLTRIVASVFDGNASEIFALAGDASVDEFVRSGLLGALAFLTAEGRIDRSETIRFLTRFDEERLGHTSETAWAAWEDAIAYLGLRELAGRVEAAWQDGRITAWLIKRDRFYEILELAARLPGDDGRAIFGRLGYVEDITAEIGDANIEDWARLEEDDGLLDLEEPLTAREHALLSERPASGPVRDPLRHIGRNDPCPCGSGKKYKKCCLAA